MVYYKEIAAYIDSVKATLKLPHTTTEKKVDILSDILTMLQANLVAKEVRLPPSFVTFLAGTCSEAIKNSREVCEIFRCQHAKSFSVWLCTTFIDSNCTEMSKKMKHLLIKLMQQADDHESIFLSLCSFEISTSAISKVLSVAHKSSVVHALITDIYFLDMLERMSTVDATTRFNHDTVFQDELAGRIVALPDMVSSVLQHETPQSLLPKEFLTLILQNIDKLFERLVALVRVNQNQNPINVRFIGRLLGKISARGYHEFIWDIFLSSPIADHLKFDPIYARLFQTSLCHITLSCGLENILFSLLHRSQHPEHVKHLLGPLIVQHPEVEELFVRNFVFVRCVNNALFCQNLIGYLGSAYASKNIFRRFELKLSETWASRSGVRHQSFEQQLYLSRLLICSAPYLYHDEPDDLVFLSKFNETVVEGITHHLESPIDKIARLGMVVGEVLTSSLFGITTDQPESRLKFSYEEDAESQALKGLATIPAFPYTIHQMSCVNVSSVEEISLAISTPRELIKKRHKENNTTSHLSTQYQSPTLAIANLSLNSQSVQQQQNRRSTLITLSPTTTTLADSTNSDTVWLLSQSEQPNSEFSQEGLATSRSPTKNELQKERNPSIVLSTSPELSTNDSTTKLMSPSADAIQAADATFTKGQNNGELDSDDEASELVPIGEGNTVATSDLANSIPRPVSVRQVLEFLNDREQDYPDYFERFVVYVRALPPLITGCTVELNDMTADLLRKLFLLECPCRMSDFVQVRLEAMIALTVAAPIQAAPFLTTQFFELNYSIGHRFELLRVIAKSAERIASLENVHGSGKIKPKNLFLLSEVTNLCHPPETPEWRYIVDKRIQEKTVHFAKERRLSSQQVAFANAFGSVAGSFFYPLLKRFDFQPVLQGSNSVPYLDIVGRDFMLLERLIYTLTSVHHSATHTSEQQKMTRAFFDFLWAIKRHEQPIIRRAVVHAYAFIFLDVPAHFLISSFAPEVAEIQTWLLGNFAQDADCEISYWSQLALTRLHEQLNSQQSETFPEVNFSGNNHSILL